VASNINMTEKDELRMMFEEAIIAHFKTRFHHIVILTEENCEKYIITSCLIVMFWILDLCNTKKKR
jgi:hypothetical protein